MKKKKKKNVRDMENGYGSEVLVYTKSNKQKASKVFSFLVYKANIMQHESWCLPMSSTIKGNACIFNIIQLQCVFHVL